jgi:hypothetical protein
VLGEFVRGDWAGLGGRGGVRRADPAAARRAARVPARYAAYGPGWHRRLVQPPQRARQPGQPRPASGGARSRPGLLPALTGKPRSGQLCGSVVRSGGEQWVGVAVEVVSECDVQILIRGEVAGAVQYRGDIRIGPCWGTPRGKPWCVQVAVLTVRG